MREIIKYKGTAHYRHYQIEEMNIELWERQNEAIKAKKEDIGIYVYPGCIIVADKSIDDPATNDYWEVARIMPDRTIEYNAEYGAISPATRETIEWQAGQSEDKFFSRPVIR